MALSAGLNARSQGSHDTSLIVYFNENSWRPDSQQLKKIDSFFIAAQGALVQRMEAHTDTIGNAVYNKSLSRRRSESVSSYLHTRLGFAPKYPIINYGKERPVSEDDNALNRRVEIRVGLPGDGGHEPAGSAENRKGIGSEMPGASDTGTETGPLVILKKYQLDKLWFKPDMAILENSSLSYIHAIALILKKYEKAVFEIRGHVNCPLSVKPGSVYMDKMNQLSADRAKLVYDLLTEEGIPAGRMSYKGMGNTEMLYPYASNEEEKRKNMRVEIYVIQTLSSQPLQQ